MKSSKIVLYLLSAVLVMLLLINLFGCGMLTPAKKPEIGPAGTPNEENPNPPILQRFDSPPAALYDLEKTAGIIFEGINKAQWGQTQEGLINLQTTWQETKPLIGEKKGVKEADEALAQLAGDINSKNIMLSYETLNKFMGSISDIGKSYKLSPLSDIIAIGNALRSVSFYTEDKDWTKAAAKIKQLQGTWNQFKPSLEKAGILGEITKTHSLVNQLKDSIIAENKGSADEQIGKINKSLGIIREFYRGK